MSNNITSFPSKGAGRGAGGPDDPTVAARVARLEDLLGRIESSLKTMETSLHRIEIEVAEIKGRVTGIEGRFSAMPTSLQLISVVVALVVAAGLFRFFEPRIAPPPQQQSRPQ